jgi:type I restriction enzyme M protein
LPENLFYNMTAPGIVIVLNRAKPADQAARCLMVNASRDYAKGDPKNYLTTEGIERIASTFRDWTEAQDYSRVVMREEIAATDYNISPTRYVRTAPAASHRPIGDILAELDALDARAVATDDALKKALGKLGL